MKRIIALALTGLISISSLLAQHKINFDFDWQFRLENNGQWQDVQLPHDWSIYLPFDRSEGAPCGYLPGGTGIYRKTFQLPSCPRDSRVAIIFDGIYHKATVYLNGQEVGYHRYGYTSFEMDLTPYIRPKGENELVVKVDRSDKSRWYTGSGIYRHAWLRISDPVHIATWGTYVTTSELSAESAKIGVRTTLVNDSGKTRNLIVRQQVEDREGRPVKTARASANLSLAPADSTDLSQSLTLPCPRLWNLDDTYMYSVPTTLLSGGRVIDEYVTPFGVRDFRFDADKGFFLNGKNLKLKGVCLHQDAGSFGTGVPDRSYERRLQILKEFGCNAIRCSHNPPSPEFLTICDTLGFVVIDEAFDKWDSGYYAQFYHDCWRSDIKDMVDRDRNHPSIILWSIGNEVEEATDDSIGPQRAAMMQDYVHSIEPTRPVIMAGQMGFTDRFGSVTDIMGYNYLENRLVADHRRFPERKMIITEAYPYYSGTRADEMRDYIEIAPWTFVQDNDFLCGSFLWAGVDYIGESSPWPSKGWTCSPFDICMFEKPAAAYLRSVWNGAPMLSLMVRDNAFDIPAGKDHWQYPPMADNWMLPYTDERIVEVRTTTTCDSVRVWGTHWDGSMKDFGFRRTCDWPNNTIVWNQPYRPDGMIIAAAYKDGVEFKRDTLRAHGPASVVRLEPDRSVLKSDGQDLSHIKLTLLDGSGLEAQADNRLVTVSVEGEGRLRCVDSGDLRREYAFATDNVKTYFAKALIVVQSTRRPGPIKVTVNVSGFPEPFVMDLESR